MFGVYYSDKESYYVVYINWGLKIKERVFSLFSLFRETLIFSNIQYLKSRTTYCWLHKGELKGVKTRGDNFLLATCGAGELQWVQKEDNLLLAT